MKNKRLPYLHTDKGRVVDDAGRRVALRGVALGGWLNMEGYMLCGRNIAESAFKAEFARLAGEEAVEDFTRSFRDNFITEIDIRTIKGWGANCVRLPVSHKVIDEAIGYIDRAVEWCRRCGVYCILDLHAAPGAQNPDWHSDCVSEPRFFIGRSNREKFVDIWRFLAGRYKDESAVAGYDLLNEPIVPSGDEPELKALYERATGAIRDAGSRQIVFLEGTDWGARISFLGKPKDSNTAYSIHAYAPPEFTFNWEPGLRYPGRVEGRSWNLAAMAMLGRRYAGMIKQAGVPLYVGEFGVHWRDGHYGELDWARDMLYLFNKSGAHWTYWTYKTVANSVFPDGIFRYTKNSPWVNRKGPVTGWENFYHLWKPQRGNIIESWKTSSFTVNEKLLKLLRGYW